MSTTAAATGRPRSASPARRSWPQNTYYAVKVVATDMLGATRTEWLSVRVKKRTATYYISRIDLADDSDSAGAGEFRGSAGRPARP